MGTESRPPRISAMRIFRAAPSHSHRIDSWAGEVGGAATSRRPAWRAGRPGSVRERPVDRARGLGGEHGREPALDLRARRVSLFDPSDGGRIGPDDRRKPRLAQPPLGTLVRDQGAVDGCSPPSGSSGGAKRRPAPPRSDSELVRPVGVLSPALRPPALLRFVPLTFNPLRKSPPKSLLEKFH